MFEWLIECIKGLGYTIGEMEISRLHSSCRFIFFLSVENPGSHDPRLKICGRAP